MTELQRKLIAIARQALDPRWWVLGWLVWLTKDLVLAGRLPGDAWAVLAGGVMGVAAAAGSDTVREIARKAPERRP